MTGPDDGIPVSSSTMKAHREAAKAAGYFVREGLYSGTPDNREGCWYVGRSGVPYRPLGAGFADVAEAWAAAAAAAEAAQLTGPAGGGP